MEDLKKSALNSYKPLYLKYRPQALSQLVGQPTAAQTLTNAIEHNRLSHAYLFTGPRGTGKTSSARILAKSLNCEKGPTATPCQTCVACEEIKEGVSPAVFELDAASNNSVDDARILIERAPLVAVGGRYKIYIIDECHMLTKEAFNALLKTLEEPPANVVFVLATTEEHKVPQTIVSRCQKLMFRLVSQSELSKYLREIAAKEDIQIEDEALELVARRSGGGLRDALGLLDQASLLSAPGKPVSVSDLLNLMGAMHEDILISMSDYIMARQGDKVLASLNQLLLEGREPAVLAQELAVHFLNLTKASYVAESGLNSGSQLQNLIIGSPKYLEALAKQATGFDRAELSQMIEQLDRLEITCRRSTQPALHLEMGLLSLCHRHDILMVKEMAERLSKLEAMVEGGSLAANVSLDRPVVHSKPLESRPVESKPVESRPAEISKPAAPVVREVAMKEEASVVSAPLPQPVAASVSAGTSDVSAPAKSAPAKASEPTSVIPDNDRLMELEMFWEQLMEYLEKKHAPTYSVLSVFAAPLQLGENEFIVGIHAANLQKTVEDKAGHIKSACEALLGRPVAVRVKVISKDAVRPRPAAKEKTTQQEESSDSEESEPAPQSAAMRTRPSESEDGGNGRSMNSANSTDAEMRNAPPPAPHPQRDKVNIPEPDAKYGDLIQEAYRLFDGPGSRKLG